jgi:hypothetical protein
VTNSGAGAKPAPMNFNKNMGMLVLAIFLIVYGITTAFAIATPMILLGLLALIAGVLILIGR